MATYTDLAQLDYFGSDFSDVLVAVGWLGREQEFQVGSVDSDLYLRLGQLLSNPFQPVVSCGSHECELCQFDGPQGSTNLFIPGDGCLYVVPELIGHYVNAHRYRPPDEFCAAVLACPEMNSMEYKQLFLKNGGRSLIKR